MSAIGRFLGAPFRDPRKASIGILLILVLALVFLYVSAPRTVAINPDMAAPKFSAVVASPARMTIQLESQGVARAQERLALTFRTGGEIVSISEQFASGRWVNEGEPLVTLDPEPYELDLTQAKYELSAAQLNLERAEANAKMARRNPSPNATRFALNIPQLEEARARVRVAKAGVERAEKDLERATLKAPFSGRLEQVSATVGQTIAGGTPVGQIYSSERMEVRLPVRDDWLQLIDILNKDPEKELDVPVMLRGRFGGQQRTWQAVVTRRESGLSRNQMTWLIAEVKPDSGSVPLEPGVYLDALIQGQEMDGIVRLPRSALINDDEVWVVDDNKRIHRQKVEWAYRNSEDVFVRDGLRPGQLVLTQGNTHLLEGVEIRLDEAMTDTASTPTSSTSASAGALADTSASN